MERMTLKQFWKSIDTDNKNMVRFELSNTCGKSIDTIQAWMLGYRKPSKLELEALKNYIRDNYQVEIIEEGGKQ